jgi:hypothetical protein
MLKPSCAPSFRPPVVAELLEEEDAGIACMSSHKYRPSVPKGKCSPAFWLDPYGTETYWTTSPMNGRSSKHDRRLATAVVSNSCAARLLRCENSTHYERIHAQDLGHHRPRARRIDGRSEVIFLAMRPSQSVHCQLQVLYWFYLL